LKAAIDKHNAEIRAAEQAKAAAEKQKALEA